MKVAVVIPLYNHARFVGAALESLRVQTRPPDRVIIIDDGSTDGSMQAVVAYAESLPATAGTNGHAPTVQTRTDFLPQFPHAGPQTTINRAVAMADDCDFITILHSDDCYHPRRIEKCLEHLAEHPELDLVCTRLRLIDEAGRTLPADATPTRWFSAAWSFRPVCDDQNALDLPEWLGLANFPGTTSNFFARASYLRTHPLRGYRHTHDYYALVLAALENKLGVIDAELLDYRVRPEDEPGSPDELVRETLRVNVDLARHLAPRIVSEPELRRAFARYQRAAWSNVSAFRADLFNLILVEALAQDGVEERAAFDGRTVGRAGRRTLPRGRRIPEPRHRQHARPRRARARADERAGGQVLRPARATFRRALKRAALVGVPLHSGGAARITLDGAGPRPGSDAADHPRGWQNRAGEARRVA